mgnify:CR=1 FL=1
MSKREIRAKRLVAAVLLAISVQMWSAPPLWAAEASVQTETSAAGEPKETKDAKAADSETGGEADADEEETVVVPVIGYSTRSAAGSDYGVMPLADMAVDGALTGVTGINDAKFYADTHDLLLGYDAKSQGTGTVALGSDANAGGQYSTAIGASASATAENSSALGMYARAGFKDSVAIGFSSNATADNMVSFGVTENGGSTWTTRRSLEGIANIDMEGALTGVTGINGSELVVDKVNNNFFIGTTEYDDFDKKSKNRAVIGLGILADPYDNISVFGTSAEGRGESASAFGYDASADEFASVFGSGANAASNGSAFGYNAEAVEQYTSAFGSGAVAGDNHTIAVGYSAKSAGTYSIAVGSEAIVEVDRGIAIGAFAHIEKYGGYAEAGNIAIGTEAHTNALYSMAIGDRADSTFKNSIAIGASSNTTAENQVSFGTGRVNTVNGNEVITWDKRRSLAGISDIDMEGALTGVTSINGSVLAAMNEDVTNKSLAIGAGAVFMDPDSSVTTISKNAIAIGNGTKVLGDGSLAIGYYAYQRVGAYAGGIESIAINGWVSLEANYNIAIGGSVVDADNVVAIGYNAASDSSNAVAIGSNTYASYDGTALGYAAQGTYHNAVAIGAYSGTTEENQVSFGHKVGDRNYADGSDYSDDLFRSLVNVADIDMHGNISLGGEWKENTTSGLYESNGKGELNGVTSINGVIFAKDSMNNQEGLLIGTLASGTSFYGAASVMIGLNIDNSAIDAVGIGNYAKVSGDGSVAIGYGAEAMSNMAMYPTAIGFFARAIGDDVVAIGAYSYAEHEYSVALGDDSSTSAENQVSFGHKAGDKYGDGGRDTYRDDLFRSLVNVADIEMHGALTGVTGIDGVTVSGTDASTGLTVGGNAVIGKTDTPFSSTGFAVAKDGAVTAKTVNGATITGTSFNGVTLSTDGKVNGAAITSNSFNGVTLEKGADSHYKVGGVDVTKMQTDVAGKADAATVTALDTRVGKSETDIGTLKTTVGDSSKGLVKDTADLKAAVGDSSKGLVKQVSDVDTAYKAADTVLQGRAKTLEDKTAGISRSGSTTTLETNTSVSSSGITTNKVTVSGATATTLENGKLTVGAATVQNTGFAVGSSSLNNGSLTVDGNNKLTTAGLTASKVTVGAVTVSGGKVSGLTDAALSAVSTEAVTGKQLNATNTTVSALDTAYKAADTQIRTDFAAADTTLQNNIDAKVAQTAYDTKMSDLDSADTALGSRAAALETAVNDSTTGLAAVNTKVGALDTAYQAADTQIRTDFAAADNALKTELNTAIDEKAKKATDLAGYGITDAYTKNDADAKITAATADMATKTQVTADIGTAKTALESAYQAADTALSNRAAALETAATGMSYDAGKNTTTFTGGVTATVLTAGEFKVGATGFGFGNDGALTAKTVNGIEIKKDESKVMVGGIDLTALSNGDVVTDNTKGIGRNQDTATTTIETNTAISSSGITTNAVTASGTVKAGEFVEGDKKLSDKYAAKTALADYTTTTDMNTKFADYATTTAVDTKLADYAKSDSVYSKAAADTAFAKAGDVDTLKTTVGDTDGGLVKDVKDLQSGKADKATTLAGYGIADAYTQTEINEKIVEATKDLATSATVTDIQSGLEEVTGKTAGLSYDTASGSSKFSGSVVIGNEGAKTHTQITDDAIIFGEGTDKQVTVDASGIHVGKKAAGGIALYADADGTHIDHTSLVTGSVTADNLNGVAISGNATDGLSVGGVSIKALSERLDSLEQDGVATADMGGIKRTDVVENSGKTIIEDTTSFTKDGLKTANLEAATAALGGVNFAAGAVTGVSSINGVVFGSDGKIGGVSLSGGKVDGVDVGWLDQRVKSLEDNGTGGGGTGGGGSSANTSGIHKPDRDTTNIEGNTSITTDGIETNKVNASDAIVVADGEKNKTVISKDGILVAEGEKNQVKINEDGIHVGKNSSVVNDTDGFITDKGLYIGVSSSSDTSTAKFSVAPNGNLSSKAGDYGFSNTSADGAKFTHSGDTAYGTGSQLDTTIQGNKVTTGRIDTDELYVDGNKVTVAGGTIGQTDAVDNHLSGTDADGNTVTNDFKTSAVNGTTQAAEKTSADGKESTKTVNNTSAGGTGVTTSRTTTDSKDNVTVKESSFGTNEKGMTLSTSNKVTDKDGKVTKDTSGTTTMTGDSISVSKTTTTTEKDADGNEKEVTKTSGTTIGSGEVTLKREDGSTIEVGSAIEGMQSDMRELDGRVSRMGVEIKEVGALSAALAGLHPQPENANSRADFAMAMGSYEGKQALAVGGFYRPDKRTMLSIGASTTSSKHMMNMGISIALDRLPEAERRAKEAAKAAGVEQETLNRVLERLAALEQDNRRLQADNEKRDVAYEKLAADYTQLKEKYIEETADRQQPEQAEAEE